MNRNFPILLAEDDENDTFFIGRALQQAGFNNPLHVSNCGVDAIRYLKAEGPYTDRQAFPFPCLLITDLKMPEMNGFELLEWLRDQTVCRTIPTLVLSSSNEQSDVTRAYELGANTYLMKPATTDELTRMLRLVLDYWEQAQCAPRPQKC